MDLNCGSTVILISAAAMKYNLDKVITNKA